MPAAARRKPARQAAKKKTDRVLVPQPHGGALSPGAGGGAQPGAGRPPSVLRDKLRGSYGERIQFLDDVIDGKVMQTIEVPLISVLPHVVCPNCGEHGQEPKGGVVSLLTVTFTAKASASVKDRIMALEQMAKYGLGAQKEVSVENVRERVQETLRIIGLHCEPEQAETLYRAIEPVWK
jgi:hypothetical protein